MNYKVCPPQLIRETSARLHAVMLEIRRVIGVRHLVFGFVTAEDRWHFDANLSVDPMRTAETETDRGLIGKALQLNKIILYPDDESHRADFLALKENPTKFEFAAPVNYDGEATGVLLADVFHKENRPTLRGDELRQCIQGYTKQLSQILDAHPNSELSLRRQINNIVQRCIIDTASKSGYLALKEIDGDLQYFDLNNETFLELSQTEGLCGIVFKSGSVLNAPDVLTQSAYVASDPEIRSEIVVPIKDGTETVAVLNMESAERSHFGDGDRYSFYGEKVIYASREAQPLVLSFRKWRGGGSPAIDVTQELMRYDGPLEDGPFARFVSNRLSYALRADRHPVWITSDPESPKPAEFDEIDVVPRKGKSLLATKNGRYLILVALRRLGETKALLGFVSASAPNRSAVSTVEQVCRIAGEVLEFKTQLSSATKMEKVIDQILTSPNTITAHDVVEQMKEVVGADHCTLYGRISIDIEEYLVVYAWTTDGIFDHIDTEMYYKIGKHDNYYDGYTGFVGTERISFHTSNLSDMPQTERDRWERRGVRWKRGMSEDGRTPVAAFICSPICDLSGQLIGVIRFAKSKGKGKLGDFDDQSKNRIECLCRMLGQAYGAQRFFSRAYDLVPLPQFASSRMSSHVPRA